MSRGVVVVIVNTVDYHRDALPDSYSSLSCFRLAKFVSHHCRGSFGFVWNVICGLKSEYHPNTAGAQPSPGLGNTCNNGADPPNEEVDTQHVKMERFSRGYMTEN